MLNVITKSCKLHLYVISITSIAMKNTIMKRNKVTTITSAQDSLSREQSRRARRYFISMMIRTLCFILTVLLPNPFRWFSLILAITLPYFAVVIASAGRETIVKPDTLIPEQKSIVNKISSDAHDLE